MALSVFEIFNVIFEDDKQVNQVIQLFALLNNIIRTWENNGHTPNELSQLNRSSEQNYLRTPDYDYDKKDESEEVNYENVEEMIAINLEVERNTKCAALKSSIIQSCLIE